MWPALCLTILAGLSCFLPDVVSAQTRKLYRKEGDQVVLKPDVELTPPITKIVWKEGKNLAAQWDSFDNETSYFRHFNGNANLNLSSGEMTITRLTKEFSAVYTPEVTDKGSVSDKKGSLIDLRIISPVPVPTVAEHCDEEMTTCTFTCEGEIKGVEEVAYKWKKDDTELQSSSRTLTVKKNDSMGITEFSCELSNPVSRNTSEPLPNPFLKTPDPEPKKGGININMGVTVLISLVAAVVVLALVHRYKAGEWFYEKESLPFEADFWRKEQRQRNNAAESNGTRDHPEQGHAEEEAQLT